MLALGSVCLLALSRSDWHVLALLIYAGLNALCCACGRCSTTSNSYIKKAHKNKNWKKKTVVINNDKGKKARLQVIEEGVVQVEDLRGQRGANGARLGRQK